RWPAAGWACSWPRCRIARAARRPQWITSRRRRRQGLPARRDATGIQNERTHDRRRRAMNGRRSAGSRWLHVAVLSGAIALALALFAPQALAQLEIKLGHVGEPGSIFQKSADEFAKRANAKLAGKAKVITYGSSQPG